MRCINHKRRTSRPGSLNPLLLLLLVIFIVLFAFVLNVSRLWVIKIEAQNNSDATSATTAQLLVDDDLLRGFLRNNPEDIPDLLVRARMGAIQAAKLNPVNAREVRLWDNPKNVADGDIIFGTLPTPGSKTFLLADDITNTTNTDLKTINTVRITTQLTRSRRTAPGLLFPQFTGLGSQDLRSRASAHLDRFVIGFRHAFDRPIPIAPIGLFADYSGSPADAKSWQAKIEEVPGANTGPDNFRFDRLLGVLVPKGAGNGDKLPEFAVSIAALPIQAQTDIATGVPLFVGIPPNDIAQLNTQLSGGMTKAHFNTFGAPFVLDTNAELEVDAATTIPDGMPRMDVHTTLTQLQTTGAIRIWPLYASVGGGKATLRGFVAARVASVEVLNPGQSLEFSVQPTMLATHAVITDASQTTKNGIPIVNPYICKVRFVE